MNDERPEDGRKYHVGDVVEFIDDDGNKVPGIVHGVRYQQGRFELVGGQRPDMHNPEGPGNDVIPGTGHMELVRGTENERHSFEYIIVHEYEHKAWWKTKNDNEAAIAAHEKRVKSHREKNKHLDEVEYGKLADQPLSPATADHPPLRQYLRVFED